MNPMSAFERTMATGISLVQSNAESVASEARCPIGSLDDESVMCLVQKGDREALGLLFDRYSRHILNVATRILRDMTEAQDLVQDVFLYVHRRSSVFDPTKGRVASWLIQITYSRALNRYEHLNARAKADCARIEELASLVDGRICLQRFTDALSAKKLIERALAELTDRQQRTLRMYFFEGYSLREISAISQESLANTRHHYYRGIERLKAALIVSL